MPQSKEVHREYMRKLRGSQKGSQDWEALPLKDIKSALPQDIVSYIENVGQRYGMTEQRFRRAYKYKVWHDANFVDGIHKDSKYRQLLEVTK